LPPSDCARLRFQPCACLLCALSSVCLYICMHACRAYMPAGWLFTVGFVQLQVQQDDQQVAVAAQQVLLGQDEAVQDGHPRHGNLVDAHSADLSRWWLHAVMIVHCFNKVAWSLRRCVIHRITAVTAGHEKGRVVTVILVDFKGEGHRSKFTTKVTIVGLCRLQGETSRMWTKSRPEFETVNK